MIRWLAPLVLAAGAALVPLACDADTEAALAALGGGCLINSDCGGGLVCVFRRCHQQCNDSVDCPIGEEGLHDRCMIGPKPDHYCQLADENDCVYNSECPGAQICGRDGECRDECETDKDCVPDQLCVSSSCALAEELDDEGQLPLASDPGPPAGTSCTYDSECVSFDPAFVCRAGVCNYECKADVDCESHVCQVAESASGGLCAPPEIACIPGVQVACDCLGGGQGVQVCNAAGTGYDACKDQNGDCGAP
jgi:hypothetical protein